MKKVFFSLLITLGLSFQAISITVNISGNVTDIANGAPVANHTVWINSDSTSGFFYSNTVQTNASGYYTVSIANVNPLDSVFFIVQTHDCNNAWLSQTVSGNTTPITVNFQICTGTPAPTVTISGTVYEAGTVIPVPNHAVTITSDSTGGFFYYNTLYTNSSGFYSATIINVPTNTSFFVSTLDCNNNTQSQTVNGNNTPITVNFYICVGPPPPSATLWGHVFTDVTFADYARVDLIYADSMIVIDSYYINDSAGMYSFSNVVPGNYYLMAELLQNSGSYGEYVPTYYISSLYWTGATLIQQGAGTNQYDIHLIPVPGYAPGSGNISGNIQQNLKSSSGTPVPNMEVILLDQFHQPLAFTITDAAGNFQFLNIAFDSYIIYPEKLAVNTTAAIVTLSAANPNANLIFLLDNGNVFLGINDKINPTIEKISDVYPNPVSDIATLSITSATIQKIKVEVINIQGQMVSEMALTLQLGENKIRTDVSSFAPGSYYIKISGQDGLSVTRKCLIK